MITDEELEALADDPELAFVQFERICRERLQEYEKEAAEVQGDADPHRLDYMTCVLAAAKEYGIDALNKWEVSSANGWIVSYYAQFSSDVNHFTTQIRIRHAPNRRQESVGLDGNSKARIKHYIDLIRHAIEQADLPEQRRESLDDKLSGLSAEVDKARTGLQAVMALYLAVSDGIGQGFQKLEPAREWLNAVAALIGRAKDVEDSLRPRLAQPAERKRLEPPRMKLPPPEPKTEQEDEIQPS
jgi:hypothetical protein